MIWILLLIWVFAGICIYLEYLVSRMGFGEKFDWIHLTLSIISWPLGFFINLDIIYSHYQARKLKAKREKNF